MKSNFLKEAKKAIKDYIDYTDHCDLYYATKLLKSVVNTPDNAELPIVEKIISDGIVSWEEVEYGKDVFSTYYACIQFPDGTHLPLPILAGYDENFNKYKRDRSLQNVIVQLAFRYCRPLRRAAIKVISSHYIKVVHERKRNEKLEEKRNQFFSNLPGKSQDKIRELIRVLEKEYKQRFMHLHVSELDEEMFPERDTFIHFYWKPNLLFVSGYVYDTEEDRDVGAYDWIKLYPRFENEKSVLRDRKFDTAEHLFLLKSLQLIEDTISYPNEMRHSFQHIIEELEKAVDEEVDEIDEINKFFNTTASHFRKEFDTLHKQYAFIKKHNIDEVVVEEELQKERWVEEKYFDEVLSDGELHITKTIENFNYRQVYFQPRNASWLIETFKSCGELHRVLYSTRADWWNMDLQ